MIRITEKIRDQILFALPELPDAEANKIATINGVSRMTVFRWMKKIREMADGETIEVNNITIAIAELAASKMREAKRTQKKLASITKQLSAA